MAYGNAQRMWTHKEYIEKYDKLKASHDGLVEACKDAKKLLSAVEYLEYKKGSREIEDYSCDAVEERLEAALAEAEKEV